MLSVYPKPPAINVMPLPRVDFIGPLPSEKLFNPAIAHDEILGYAVDDRLPEHRIVVVDADVGLEVDTILALINKFADSRPVTIHGVAVDEIDLKHAQIAAYRVDQPLDAYRNRYEQNGWMFDVAMKACGVTFEDATTDTPLLRTDMVRERHNVTFERQDLRRDFKFQEADFVLCNNFLRRHDPEEAIDAVLQAAECVAPRGFLCLGADPMQRLITTVEDDERYTWEELVQKVLQPDFVEVTDDDIAYTYLRRKKKAPHPFG